MRKYLFVALAGSLALSACHRHPDEGESGLNNDVATNNAAAPAPPATPAPAQNATNAAAPAEKPPTVAEEQQMRDDADATGLTARLPQGGNEAAPVGNQMQP